MINLQAKSPNLLVIGDLMIDHYLWGVCDRVSPEAPVQVVNVDYESTLLGGAGNVINNLKALGANVDVIGIVGGCEISDELKGLLDDIEVDTKYLFIEQDRITSKKSRIIASQQQVVRYDRESADEINHKSNFMNDLGADSLDTIEIVMSIEEEFDIEIPDHEVEEMHTVGSVLNYLTANLSNG